MHCGRKMRIRTMIGTTAVSLLALCGASLAQADGPAEAGGLLAYRLPTAEVQARRPAAGAGVVLAQAGDPLVNELREQIRQLNGKLEELNFQLLQMQDQMRKQQEDNEFRFQELEKGGGGAGAAPADVRGAAELPAAERRTRTAAAGDAGTGAGAGAGTGAPPRTLGTIRFDARGQPIDETVTPGSGDTQVAALPATGDPEELYRDSYQLILSGDYDSAEAGFRDHIRRFPDNPRAADAHFWLGESLLGQDRYQEAAQVFLDANRSYPKAKKAPDMLLKLGIALSAMNQRDIACGTYREIGQRYPQASAALKERVKQEQALAGC